MYGYIYKTTNLINNKIYIGQHKSDIFDITYYGSGKLLKNSINKYGLDNFKCEILKECFNKDELDYYEIFFIKQFNSTNKEVGYNITTGGYGCRGYIFSKEDREKIGSKSRENNLKRDKTIYDKVSKKHIGKKMMNNGKEQHWINQENIEEMKNLGWTIGSCKRRNRDYSGKNNTMYGKSAVKDRKWIHRYIDGNLERLYVNKDVVDKYIKLGWKLGMK